ncbi:MAG: hypothetical protein ABSG86_22900 [Thermoguttaceae bacterium]
MLCELLARLFGRGDPGRPPIRSIGSGAANPPEREQEPELDSAWSGPAAGDGPAERQSGTAGWLVR